MLTFSGNCRYIVLLAIQDEAYRFGRYYKYVLKRLNINPRSIRLGFRSSLAAIGYVGRKPYWVKQMSRLQRRGPSYVSARIPLGRGEEITIFKCICLLTFQVATISIKDMVLTFGISLRFRCLRHSNQSLERYNNIEPRWTNGRGATHVQLLDETH